MSPIRCEVVTAERMVFSDDVDMVLAPGTEGQLGILPDHAPLITTLDVGELIIRRQGEEDIHVAVGGGFMEVHSDGVTILADTAERAEEIDVERAEAARQRAETLLQQEVDEEGIAQAIAALRRSSIRLKVARKRRRRYRPATGPGEAAAEG